MGLRRSQELNTTQLYNHSVELATKLIHCIRKSDLGEAQLCLLQTAKFAFDEALYIEYEALCESATARVKQWPLYKTKSCVSFYAHELVLMVNKNTLDFGVFMKMLLEMSIGLKFNVFTVTFKSRKHLMTKEQEIKLLKVINNE